MNSISPAALPVNCFGEKIKKYRNIFCESPADADHRDAASQIVSIFGCSQSYFAFAFRLCLVTPQTGCYKVLHKSRLFAKVPRAFLVPLVRKYLLAKPIRYLSEAARKVAAGDFTVQLAPIRTDGQKDEFEVLIDDFNTMTAELASSEMLKNDFISTVSHEFKTPLSVIQNYETMLQSDGISEDERREYSEKISDAARRLTVLVTNILHLNRLEHQKIPVQKVRST